MHRLRAIATRCCCPPESCPDKGEISKLKDVKLNDKILQEYPEMRDIKKQSEWS